MYWRLASGYVLALLFTGKLTLTGFVLTLLHPESVINSASNDDSTDSTFACQELLEAEENVALPNWLYLLG